MPVQRIYPAGMRRQEPMPYAPGPDPSGDVPWAMRYTLPVAALAIAAFLLFAGWLLTL
jgi:hypothetical protein